MSAHKDSELTVEKFVGHRVRIHFRKPAETEGVPFKISTVEAKFHAYVPGEHFTLRDITAAFDENGNEVSRQAGLFGNGMMGHPFNILVLESPTPVV